MMVLVLSGEQRHLMDPCVVQLGTLLLQRRGVCSGSARVGARPAPPAPRALLRRWGVYSDISNIGVLLRRQARVLRMAGDGEETP